MDHMNAGPKCFVWRAMMRSSKLSHLVLQWTYRKQKAVSSGPEKQRYIYDFISICI